MTFGVNLRYFRIRKGLTLQELAERLHVSANYLSTLENNNGKIKPEFLPRLCAELGIQLTDLFEATAERRIY
ncbi:helix-turn-helix domain-containing protein [Paenibacillus abyssi]|uniref:HTH cro/C1-type domain-containing protein n=1 Tax=Paenibacillus abyssi TaxID=1340531 RepID=A0A917FWB0_9BACL|nr:hypothetical protein GCM10010916_25680 [Paenibacillus abyssi]